MKDAASVFTELLDGEQEAAVIAWRPPPRPQGYSGSPRLLAPQVVELGIVDSISRETVSRTLE